MNPERGGYIPPEEKRDDKKSWLKKTAKGAGIVGGVTAALLAAGGRERPQSPEQFSAEDVLNDHIEQQESNRENEKNLDDIKNNTSDKISADFGPINFEDWEKIIDAYEAGFYIYGGRAGKNLLALKNSEGRDMLVPLSDWVEEEIDTWQEVDQKDGEENERSDQWWQEAPSDSEQERLADMGVVEGEGLFKSIDLTATAAEILGREQTAELSNRLSKMSDPADQEKLLWRINNMSADSLKKLSGDINIWQSSLDFLIEQIEKEK